MKNVHAAVIAAILLAAAPVYAQQGPEQPGDQSPSAPRFDNARGRGGSDADKREEVRKKIEAVRMWRLTEALKLDEKTSARLASFLSALDEKRRDLLHERRETTGDLRALLKTPNPDEKKLRADLDKFEKNRRNMMKLDEKETSGVKDILSVEQQARYVIFQQEFRREMRGMIAGARSGARNRDRKPGPEGEQGGPPER